MLKRLIGCAGTMVVTLWLAGVANALPFMDIVNPEPDVFIGKPPSSVFTYSHSIVDDGFVLGQDLDPVRLTLDVYDESRGQPGDKSERVTVDIDGHNYGTFVITGVDLTLTVASNLLEGDGILEVTLTRSKGDFLFAQSTLEAEVAQTPEPSTLILLGSGLAGVACLGFRCRQKGDLS